MIKYRMPQTVQGIRVLFPDNNSVLTLMKQS